MKGRMDSLTDVRKDKQTNTQNNVQKDRQTGRQAGLWKDRQVDRKKKCEKIDGQIDIQNLEGQTVGLLEKH